jgi:hypothetical protein
MPCRLIGAAAGGHGRRPCRAKPRGLPLPDSTNFRWDLGERETHLNRTGPSEVSGELRARIARDEAAFDVELYAFCQGRLGATWPRRVDDADRLTSSAPQVERRASPPCWHHAWHRPWSGAAACVSAGCPLAEREMVPPSAPRRQPTAHRRQPRCDRLSDWMPAPTAPDPGPRRSRMPAVLSGRAVPRRPLLPFRSLATVGRAARGCSRSGTM